MRKEGIAVKLRHTANRYMKFMLTDGDGLAQIAVFSQNATGRSQLLIVGQSGDDTQVDAAILIAACNDTDYVKD